MESKAATPSASAKRLWQIVRVVFLMFREGLAKRRLFSDLRLHFLFHQGKIAGKSIRSFISDFSHHQPSSIHSSAIEAFSCRFMDPKAAISPPREVQFSCNSTPFHAATRRQNHRRDVRRHRHIGYDATAVARAFEFLDLVPDNEDCVEEIMTPMMSLLATPAASVRHLRVTDSPFPLEEVETDELVDREAERFIRKFYEQLRRQQMRT